MARRIKWSVWLFIALTACSDKQHPQSGSQTHFLQTCDVSCPAPYECICGACTLTCKDDAPCRDEAESARCTVAVNTADSLQCNTNDLVCDVACQRQSDCNSLGAGYTCEGSRCRAAPRDSATSTGSGASGETPPPPEICDGSDGIRLGIWNTDGSFSSPGWRFISRIAVSFAFIDGHCRFYVSADPRKGVVTGTLDAAQSEQLASELELASFGEFQGYNYAGCFDGGTSIVSDGARSFACMCGMCGADAPAGLADALDAGQRWVKQLGAAGAPWDGAISAVATASLLGTHTEMPQSWPLTRAIDDILMPIGDITPDSGAVFDAPADVAALRRLRTQQATVFPPTEEIYVTDGAKNYALYERDELPKDTTAALTAFQETAWKPIEDAANARAAKELAARDAGSP